MITSDKRGVTLVELMIATMLISVGILGSFAAFRYITKALYVSRTGTLGTNLAQERIEALKNLSYYELLVTTVAAVNNEVPDRAFLYDAMNYPPEDITIGGVKFTRYTYVSLAQIDSNAISTVTYTYPDTGMKQVEVTVVWDDAGTKRKWTLTNLANNPYVNPLDSTITGTVNKASGGALPGAIVIVEQNPDWNAITNSAGSYSFRVYHGSYTVRASSYGYYDGISGNVNALAGSSNSAGTISLTAIATGTIVGNVWINNDLVISNIVVSSAQANQSGFEVQVIELFNPTTFPINIGGSPPVVKLNVGTNCNGAASALCQDVTHGVKLTYISTYVAPNTYYLIANTNTFTLAGSSAAADAVYSDDADTYCSNAPNNGYWNTGTTPMRKRLLPEWHAGSVWLQRNTQRFIDAVGWNHTGDPNPPYCEGTCIDIGTGGNGFPPNHQIIRLSSPTPNFSSSTLVSYGRAYDSHNNNEDFTYQPAISDIVIPFFSTQHSTRALVAGKPAFGSIVASSDPYSGAVISSMSYVSSGTFTMLYSSFTLRGVTTGYWQLTIASDTYNNQYTRVWVNQGVTTSVPNGATLSSWTVAGNMSAFLSSNTVTGFVKGVITDPLNNPLSGIQVIAGGGVKTTAANGAYFVQTASGPITINANPANLNPAYVQSIVNTTLNEGEVLTQDFILSQGGNIQGYLTTGTTPLPNYNVAAKIGGSQYGTATTQSSGYFTMRGMSTGTYTIQPVLEIGQDSSPNSVDVSLTAGNTTVFAGTFTVTDAFGTIVGTITYNSSLITSGALIIASTGTISSTPPAIAASSSTAWTPIYAASSKADGSYTLPVRGANTYYISVYIPLVSASGSVSITTKTYNNIYVSPGQSTTKAVSLP